MNWDNNNPIYLYKSRLFKVLLFNNGMSGSGTHLFEEFVLSIAKLNLVEIKLR